MPRSVRLGKDKKYRLWLQQCLLEISIRDPFFRKLFCPSLCEKITFRDTLFGASADPEWILVYCERKTISSKNCAGIIKGSVVTTLQLSKLLFSGDVKLNVLIGVAPIRAASLPCVCVHYWWMQSQWPPGGAFRSCCLLPQSDVALKLITRSCFQLNTCLNGEGVSGAMLKPCTLRSWVIIVDAALRVGGGGSGGGRKGRGSRGGGGRRGLPHCFRKLVNASHSFPPPKIRTFSWLKFLGCGFNFVAGIDLGRRGVDNVSVVIHKQFVLFDRSSHPPNWRVIGAARRGEANSAGNSRRDGAELGHVFMDAIRTSFVLYPLP